MVIIAIVIIECMLDNATKLMDASLTLRFIGPFTLLSYSYSLHKFVTQKPETCFLVRYHFLLA
jgi:hypothetical protein